jgi:hypothetical protein
MKESDQMTKEKWNEFIRDCRQEFSSAFYAKRIDEGFLDAFNRNFFIIGSTGNVPNDFDTRVQIFDSLSPDVRDKFIAIIERYKMK